MSVLDDGTDEDLIRELATATRIACSAVTGARHAALEASFDQARAVPSAMWERKAAAHAEFFNALADATPDPWLAPALGQGAAFAYDLMMTVGRAADGIVIGSRQRVLGFVRAGKPREAAHEMEGHLRTLRFMCRLTSPVPSAPRPVPRAVPRAVAAPGPAPAPRTPHAAAARAAAPAPRVAPAARTAKLTKTA